MTTTHEITTADGRTLVAHDSGPQVDSPLTILWHHGSPQTGAILPPVATAAAERGIRVVSYGRPSYGGSSPQPGRSIASAADDVRAVVDALAVDRFASVGASGGGPPALASAWGLPDRVVGVVCLAGIAPFSDARPHFGSEDWFSGMQAPGGLQSALEGRDARARFAETDDFDGASFIAADYEALGGEWSSLGDDSMAAGSAGPDGLVDDDVSMAAPWGFELADVAAPVLLVQGRLDRVVPPSHARAQLAALPDAELWIRPRDGHVSVLRALPVALDWLLGRR